MERREKYKNILLIIIVLILIVATVFVTLIVSGKLTFNINLENPVTNNTTNNTNDQSNSNDPYSKYSNIKWSTNIKYNENWFKAWIDDSLNLNIQLYDWNTETNKFDIPGAITVKQLPNNEKVKYFEYVSSPQAAEIEYMIVLSTDNNLYYVGIEGSNKIFKLNSDNNKVIALTRNIDTKTQLQYTRNDIYALLDNGKLVKVYEEYKSNPNEIIAELGLTYEECNLYKTTLVVGPYGYGYYITNENYMRKEDITRSYIPDENNNKLVIKYYFQAYGYGDGDCYFVSKTNKLYKLDFDNDKIELVNSKIVSNVQLNGTIINVKYEDNTTEKFELISASSYEDKINPNENEAYDFSNQSDREIYAVTYLFKQF